MADMTLRELRKLVEKVSGWRKKALAIVLDPKTGQLAAVEQSSGVTPLVTIAADPRGPKTVLRVILPDVDTSGWKEHPPGNDFGVYADALFWSLSALEKFMVPYYSQFEELKDVQKKLDDFTASNSNVVAYIHLPDSETVAGQTPQLAALVQRGEKLTLVPLL